MQSVAVVHDTLDSRPPLFPAGRGTGWGVQALPFHCSATGVPSPPTAVQALAAGHDTPNRGPPPGVSSIVQAAPFHRSASGSERLETPTVMQAVAVGQDTAEKALLEVPLGIGAG